MLESTPTRPQFRNSQQKLSIIRSINPSLDDAALGIFYSQQVCGRVGTFEYLRRSEVLVNMSAHVASAVRAIGLISLSRTHFSPVAEREAIQVYGVAVRQMSDKLNSSAAAEDDALLVALLLDRYDAIAKREVCEKQNPDTSTAHLAGAIAISKAKGLQQFQSRLGRRLFQHMASRNLVNSAKEGQMIPTDIIALHTFMSQNVKEAERPAWIMSSIVSRMVNLNAKMKAGTFGSVREIVTCALQLDQELETLLHNMPENFTFDVLFVGETFCPTSGGCCQIHPDFWIALIWNLIRANRILLNEMIYMQIRNMHSSDSDTEEGTLEFRAIETRSIDTINDMALDICATVPQQAGFLRPWLESRIGTVSPPDITTTGGSMPSSYTRALSLEREESASNMLRFQGSAYSLLWPLYVIGQCQGTRFQGCTTWVIEKLRFIGVTYGISQSLALATSLERKDPLPVWSVYDLLGSYSRLPEQSECYDGNGQG